MVWRTVMVEFTWILMSPLREEKYSAVKSSVQPSITCRSQLPTISAHRLLGYRFCSWPKLCTARVT